MKLKKGQELPKLKSGLYSLKLERHTSSLYPLVKAEDVEEKMKERGYYDKAAVEDIEISGPFKHLDLISKI